MKTKERNMIFSDFYTRFYVQTKCKANQNVLTSLKSNRYKQKRKRPIESSGTDYMTNPFE